WRILYWTKSFSKLDKTCTTRHGGVFRAAAAIAMMPPRRNGPFYKYAEDTDVQTYRKRPSRGHAGLDGNRRRLSYQARSDGGALLARRSYRQPGSPLCRQTRRRMETTGGRGKQAG